MAVVGLILVAILLGAWHSLQGGRELDLATGAQSNAQLDFFVQSAERPDLKEFYEKLTPAARLHMAENIGKYRDPRMAKLLVSLLQTYDPAARKGLTASLVLLAENQPKAVADQLGNASGLQLASVEEALRSLGEGKSISAAVQELPSPNAVDFLVQDGHSAAMALEAAMDRGNGDVKIAAAEGLSRLGDRNATPKLIAAYLGAQADTKPKYLEALSTTGDPQAKGLLLQALSSTSIGSSERAIAMTGLARIGVAGPIWTYVSNPDPVLAHGAIDALVLAGNAALDSGRDPTILIRIAAQTRSSKSDRYLISQASNPAALRAMAHRPELVGELMKHLSEPAIEALATTPEGRNRLETVKGEFEGLAKRALVL